MSKRLTIILIYVLIVSGCSASQETPADSAPTVTDILNLVLTSHTTWHSVEGTARTAWHMDGEEDQIFTTAFTFIQPARGKIVPLAGPDFLDKISWISDGSKILETNLTTGVQTISDLPRFASDTSMIPQNVDEVDPDTVYRHPFTGLVPSPLSEYIFPNGFAQGGPDTVYELIGQESVIGRETWVMTATVRGQTVTAWIDQQTGVILKYQQEESSPTLNFEVLEIQFDGDVDEGTIEILPEEPQADLQNPSPDGQTPIPSTEYFSSEDLGWLASTDGFTVAVHEPGQSGAINFDLPDQSSGPSISPSGDWIAYWYNNGLEIFETDTGEIVRVSKEIYGGYGTQTAWSPDEAQVVIGCYPNENHPISEVCLFDLTNGEMQPLTDMTAYTTDPYGGVEMGNWSAEGNLLVFLLMIPPPQSGYSQNLIFVLDMDTYQPRLLFDQRTQRTYSRIYQPRISPDGTKILAVANVNGGNNEILLIEVSSGAITLLTHSPNGQNITNPLWIDNKTFTATTYAGQERIAQAVYNLAGEVIGELDIPASWRLLQIQPAD
ncbi:hypothetical protein KQH61_04070 [bacterium]|nr:hypothetical protein [bacterium]MCB2179079.1 hypothetical protein [bacterium]